MMKNSGKGWKRVIVLLMVIAFTGVLAGLSFASDAIRVGCCLTITGKYAKAGKFFKRGYKMAIDEINAKGGIALKKTGKKMKVKLILYDDKSDPTTAVNLSEHLITVDKVNVMLGSYSTSQVNAQTVVPEKYGVPYVNGGGASSFIYGRGFKWIFGTLASISQLSFTEMTFMKGLIDQKKLPKPCKLAISWENNAHGKDFEAGVKAAIKKYPGYFKLVLDEPFQKNTKNYAPLLIKVKSVNADAYLSDCHFPQFSAQHKQYSEMGLYHKFVTYGARGPESNARKSLGAAVNYLVAAQWWTPLLPYPQSKAFVKMYKERYKEDISEWYPALAYETARVLFKAIENAGSLDKKAIRDALENMNYDTSLVAGQVLKFNKKTHQASYPYVLVQNYPKGKIVAIYPKNAATGKVVCPIPKK